MSEGGPGWVGRPLSEIKPGCFKEMKKLERELQGVIEEETVGEKILRDPMEKYIRGLRRRNREFRSEERGTMRNDKQTERMQDYRMRRGLGDNGVSLLTSCLKDIPREEMTTMKNDPERLRHLIKEAARQEEEKMRSKIKPNSAKKLYAWSSLLDERDVKSKKYSCQPIPSEKFMPDSTSQMIKVYHRNHGNLGKVHLIDDYWQIPRVGPPVYRDRYGMQILRNLEMEENLMVARKTDSNNDYYYDWPLVDKDSGVSVQSFVKEKL